MNYRAPTLSMSHLAQTLPEAQLRWQMTHPYLLQADRVLMPALCEQLIHDTAPYRYPMGTVNTQGQMVPSTRRRCQGISLKETFDVFDTIETLFETLFLWPRLKTEYAQVVEYTPGQYFDFHHDFFGPSQAQAKGYQRVGTALIYLNETDGEGPTVYQDLGLSIYPHQGSLLYMHYPDQVTDNPTRHAGGAMVSQTKYVLIKWFLDRPFTG